MALMAVAYDPSYRNAWYKAALEAFAAVLSDQSPDVDWRRRANSIQMPTSPSVSEFNSPLDLESIALISLLEHEQYDSDLIESNEALSDARLSAYRRLVESGRDELKGNLARALLERGQSLSRTGRRIVSLEAIGEAVALYRDLAQQDPGEYLSPLATALINNSAALAAVGRAEEALISAKEATTLCRQLTDRPSPGLAVNLARALHTLSIRQSEVRQYEQALASSEEAATLYRQLSDEDTYKSLPELAGALDNLSVNYSTLGRVEEAITTEEEALAIYRGLAEKRPEFRSGLASSLHKISAIIIQNLDGLTRRSTTQKKQWLCTGNWQPTSPAASRLTYPKRSGLSDQLLSA